MSDLTNTKYKKYPFNQEGAEKIKTIEKKGQNWPVVYILNGDKEAYVGETNNAYRRINQHLENTRRSVMNNILLLINDSFNKSATLDIESKLIQFMHADGKFELQNENAGQSIQHNYYQRGLYEQCFKDIWNELKRKKLANKTLYEIKNSEIFKYSPYKELTEEQFACVEKLLEITEESLEKELSQRVVVQGGAGTGKTVLAIYFIKCLVDILSRNTNFKDLDEVLPEDSPVLQFAQLVKMIQKNKNLKIAFVVPTPSFRETVKKIFKATRDLKPEVIAQRDANLTKFENETGIFTQRLFNYPYYFEVPSTNPYKVNNVEKASRYVYDNTVFTYKMTPSSKTRLGDISSKVWAKYNILFPQMVVAETEQAARDALTSAITEMERIGLSGLEDYWTSQYNKNILEFGDPFGKFNY